LNFQNPKWRVDSHYFKNHNFSTVVQAVSVKLAKMTNRLTLNHTGHQNIEFLKIKDGGQSLF